MCPSKAWLAQQQAALAAVWSSAGGAEVDAATAQGLRAAYSSWQVRRGGCAEPVS
jgi:hypothetical protein